jgi:archaellum component FlaC
MTAFSYVFTGNSANDGTGTPLRNAFQIIDSNFANIAAGNVTITVNSPVLTVANRTGNIHLTVSDVAGAASYASLVSLVAAGNAYVDSQVAIIGSSNVSVINSNVAALGNIVAANSANIATLFGNVATIGGEITSLTSSISAANANAVSTNSNVATLSNSVNNLNTTVSGVNDNISTLFGNVVTIDAEIASIQAGAYTNANAAAYLPTHTGNVGAREVNFTSGQSFRVVAAPAHLYGAVGDVIGDVAFDSTNIYNCFAPFIGNTDTIISHVGQGDLLAAGPNGSNLLQITGIPSNEWASIRTTSNVYVKNSGNTVIGSVTYFSDNNSGNFLFNEGASTFSGAGNTFWYVPSATWRTTPWNATIYGNTQVTAYLPTYTGNLSYTMGNSQNWNSNVSTVSSALDQLAARLKASGH